MACNNNESVIGRGTTSTLTFDFSFDASTVAAAWLNVEQLSSNTVIERELDTAIVYDKSLEWRLTQEETLRLSETGIVQVQVRWRLQDGTAGETPIFNVPPYGILREGVI